MSEKGSQKVGVGAEDLSPEGSLMALAHPDSQQQMYRGQAMPNEKIPRDLDVVESLAASDDPFVGFVRGEKRIYLTERSLGADVVAGLDKGRSLAIEGEGGTWGKVPASQVKKKHGGYSFGSRMGTPAATAAPSPAAQEALDPAPPVQPAPRASEEARPLPPEVLPTPEAALPPEAGFFPAGGGRPDPAGPEDRGAAAETEEPEAPKAVIPFLEERRPLGPPARPLPTAGGAVAFPAPRALPEPTRPVEAGGVDRRGPQVTLAVGHRPRQVARGRGPFGDASDPGGLPWWAGIGLFAAGALLVLAGGGWRAEGPRSYQDYLKWERRQLLREIDRRQLEHERHVGRRKAQDDLRLLEAEERKIAAMVEEVEVLNGRIR